MTTREDKPEDAATPPTVTYTRTVIDSTRSWSVSWRELVDYRDLLRFLVWRDISVIYKQTVMGLAWALLRPLLSMVIFSVVFGMLAEVPSDGIPYPIFAFTALVPWTYFSTALTKASSSLVTNRQLLTKVYFPRYFIPATPVLAGLLDFAIAFVLLIFMMIGYGIIPTAGILILPVLIGMMVLAALGVGMWSAALSVRYRDVEYGMQFAIPLLLYAAPVVWPASLLTDRFPQHATLVQWLYGLFPMAGVIEGFRSALLGQTPMPWILIASGSISALLLFLTGAAYFRYTEDTFADVA